jgi:hypothetical protein
MSDQINYLWEEYKGPFLEFDDLSLARWLSQTLGQMEGRVWRVSHPLISAYRAAAEIGNERDIWNKRLATLPHAFSPAECCRAPLLPLFTRDVLGNGFVCPHCGATAVEFADLPKALRESTEEWAEEYANAHAVAHYDENQMRSAGDYDELFEKAASDAEKFLRTAAIELLPRFLEYYPALLWEDHDECLEVEPGDIDTWSKTA